MATKSERFAKFLERLDKAPLPTSFDEAFALICDTLNAVEDELSGVPSDPAHWMTDGRMDPPQEDSRRPFPSRPDVQRFVSEGDHTLIGKNGAIEVRDRSGVTISASQGQTVR